MLHQGHLRELMSDRGRKNFARGREQHQGPPKPPSPARTIQMIISGGNDASINNVKFTTIHKMKRSITYEQYDDLEASIIFDESDTNVERTSGEITLPVLAGGITLETTFHIMDQDTTYNAIIGRP
nr:uncharacterized protein LOC104105235 [Nicotiana tomentosiformis]